MSVQPSEQRPLRTAAYPRQPTSGPLMKLDCNNAMTKEHCVLGVPNYPITTLFEDLARIFGKGVGLMICSPKPCFDIIVHENLTEPGVRAAKQYTAYLDLIHSVRRGEVRLHDFSRTLEERVGLPVLSIMIGPVDVLLSFSKRRHQRASENADAHARAQTLRTGKPTEARPILAKATPTVTQMMLRQCINWQFETVLLWTTDVSSAEEWENTSGYYAAGEARAVEGAGEASEAASTSSEMTAAAAILTAMAGGTGTVVSSTTSGGKGKERAHD